MNTTEKKTKLEETLAKLERNLETPIVPGEMEPWTNEVERAFLEFEPLYLDVVNNDHPRALNQISHEDPGLMRRIEQLKEQDRHNLDSLTKLRKRLDRLSGKAEILEPDEARIENRLEDFIDKGLEFVIEVRKQERAMETWITEAISRDRGVVD